MNQCNECKHYLKDETLSTTSDCSLNEYILCEQIPDCYYKQLQQLKQENESLKEKIETYNCNSKCLYRQKLENINKIANKTCTSGCRCIDKTDILQIIEGKENNADIQP